MNEKELIGKVHSSVYHQCRERGFAAPVDVLMDVGVLTKEKYEDWRFGRVPYLEQVCNANLHKLPFIMAQIRSYAKKNGYKPSVTCYKRWGVKKKGGMKRTIPLRFSKSGTPEIERLYATHYVDEKRIAEMKTERASAGNTLQDNPENADAKNRMTEYYAKKAQASITRCPALCLCPEFGNGLSRGWRPR